MATVKTKKDTLGKLLIKMNQVSSENRLIEFLNEYYDFNLNFNSMEWNENKLYEKKIFSMYDKIKLKKSTNLNIFFTNILKKYILNIMVSRRRTRDIKIFLKENNHYFIKYLNNKEKITPILNEYLLFMQLDFFNYYKDVFIHYYNEDNYDDDDDDDYNNKNKKIIIKEKLNEEDYKNYSELYDKIFNNLIEAHPLNFDNLFLELYPINKLKIEQMLEIFLLDYFNKLSSDRFYSFNKKNIKDKLNKFLENEYCYNLVNNKYHQLDLINW